MVNCSDASPSGLVSSLLSSDIVSVVPGIGLLIRLASLVQWNMIFLPLFFCDLITSLVYHAIFLSSSWQESSLLRTQLITIGPLGWVGHRKLDRHHHNKMVRSDDSELNRHRWLQQVSQITKDKLFYPIMHPKVCVGSWDEYVIGNNAGWDSIAWDFILTVLPCDIVATQLMSTILIICQCDSNSTPNWHQTETCC